MQHPQVEIGIGHNKPPPLEFEFTDPQFELITSDAQFPAFVGGFGSGKTEALTSRAIALKRRYPMCNVGYYMPTFDLVRQIAYPRFEEKLTSFGFSYKLNKSLAWFEIENCGKIIFRTMDSPGRIIGYEHADCVVDELDTLKTDDARNVWRKIIARNRQKKPDGSKNTIAVGTTPEGYRFVYEAWEKNPKAGYKLIRASTYSNARNLPDGYIQTLLDMYPSSLITAYIEGLFTNLTSGTVYACFDRELNRAGITEIAEEYLHIGMDFNVGKMAAIVWVVREYETEEYAIAVKEIIGVLDTPAMIKAIKARFPNNKIIIYPDASGASRKSNNASVSDISLLRDADFTVMNNLSNPAVKDRLLSMNVMFEKRRALVNSETCPVFADALEKQAFDKKGEPDKTNGFDHSNDAGGYFISYRYPIKRPSSQHMTITGV